MIPFFYIIYIKVQTRSQTNDETQQTPKKPNGEQGCKRGEGDEGGADGAHLSSAGGVDSSQGGQTPARGNGGGW